MARDVTMPKLGQTMEEGTVVNTLVKVGDKVAKGDVLFEVETDKATLEADSPADGFVKAILVKNGETVPVNAPILILGEEHETVEAGGQKTEDRSQKAEGSATTKVIRLPKLGQTMEEGTIVNTDRKSVV